MDLESLDNMILNDSDSDDDLEFIAIAAMEVERLEAESSRRSKQRRTVIQRGHLAGQQRLFLDYFADQPVFPPNVFRRRFRMRRSLFLRIHSEVEAHDPYFVQKRNNAGVLGLSSLQKTTAAIRILGYGIASDFIDEYLRIAESTAMQSLRKFVKAVVEIYSDEYLRSPNNDDIARLLAIGESRGFPGMLGSIDCMHWIWKNCPTAWKGMYTGHAHEPTLILEAVASQDLWIWHAFFGLPGSHNDINVLERSSVFSELSQGRAPPVNYTVNGNNYTMGYYLADGIYPPWATFVKTIPCPQTRREKYFAMAQESCRKDVERAFGVLQARFAILRGPARPWDVQTLNYIMKACIILHNMIVEDERDENLPLDYEQSDQVPIAQPSHENRIELTEFLHRHRRIRDRGTHSQLQSDLVKHLWALYSQFTLLQKQILRASNNSSS